jgi:hypothetical protein
MYTIVRNVYGTYDVYMESETDRFPTLLNVKDSFEKQSQAVDFLNASRNRIFQLTGSLPAAEVTFKAFAQL